MTSETINDEVLEKSRQALIAAGRNPDEDPIFRVLLELANGASSPKDHPYWPYRFSIYFFLQNAKIPERKRTFETILALKRAGVDVKDIQPRLFGRWLSAMMAMVAEELAGVRALPKADPGPSSRKKAS